MGERRRRSMAPARTSEGRESQMINLAMSLAEEKLKNGTASSQIIVHYLNLGTEKAKLERMGLEADVELKRSKAKVLEMQATSEEVAQKALEAFKSYAGLKYEEDDDEDD